MRVDLPDGGWADLRERVTNGDRKRFIAHLPEQGTTTTTMAAMIGADALISFAVTAWSYAGPIPSLDDGAYLNDELEADTYDALLAACGEKVRNLFPNFDPTPEPGTPTQPSAA